VLIFIIVGLLVVLKYRKNKEKIYIWWGIGLLGIGLPWAGSGFSFLSIILIGEGLSIIPYFFIMTFWMAITLFFWMWTMTDLMFKKKEKIILSFYAITGIIFEIYFVYSLITDPSVIGVLQTPPLDSNYRGITMFYTIFGLVSISISLFLFIRVSLKYEDPEIKLKAKILLIAMISYIFGAIADAYLTLTILTIFIIRIILISSAIEYYIGWILPQSIKKLLLKKI
jgi:hypothetical protein